jgi:hypothetical protein
MSTTDQHFDLSMMRYPRQIDEWEGRVLSALKSYQIIETVLKIYLVSDTEDRQNNFGKKHTQASILNLPLGVLLSKFDKVNTNVTLKNTLKSINRNRNLIAHQVLVLQNPKLAMLVGGQEINLLDLKQLERKAIKAMCDLICEFISHQNHFKPSLTTSTH